VTDTNPLFIRFRADILIFDERDILMNGQLQAFWRVIEDSRRLRLDLEESIVELYQTRKKLEKIQRKPVAFSILPEAAVVHPPFPPAKKKAESGARPDTSTT
jgi:hypothetical protein